MQSEQFTDGIGTRTRNHYISQGKQIFQFGFNIFKLNISFQGLERIVYLAFSTEVDYMKIFEKVRQNLADCIVDDNGAEASSND